MEVLIFPDALSLARKSADLVESQIKAFPDSVIGLATGSTPLGLYEELIMRHAEHDLSFAQVKTFNLDEYVGIPSNHPQSYRTFMDKNLFNRIDIDQSNTQVPDGMAENPLATGPAYEKMIEDSGGIDLQILGVGTDGHIGFNEPTSSLGSITRVKTLTQQTIEDNSRFFSPNEFQPKLAITMGIKTILDARRILLLAHGENKSNAIRDMIEGPLAAFCPASALQLHQRTTILVDEAAASKLSLKGYYKFVGEMQDELVRKHRPSDWISR
ncbi:MAG: glucosamine-6-phosphate deaminase [Verrucomicrobia bacterium TMED44]|nr:MAG: glucosamine-6-phosphate deaminase [Verrucomicrobia bacterium TMED44]